MAAATPLTTSLKNGAKKILLDPTEVQKMHRHNNGRNQFHFWYSNANQQIPDLITQRAIIFSKVLSKKKPHKVKYNS